MTVRPGIVRIGIIGAGASGLTQLKHVLEIWRRPDVGSQLEVVVFESRDEIGGTWYFDDRPKRYLLADSSSDYHTSQQASSSRALSNGQPSQLDGEHEKSQSHGLNGHTSHAQSETMYFYPPKGTNPSPMYQGLRTNLPNDLMSFRGFPFPPDTPVYPNCQQVFDYLLAYVKNYDLRPHIRFNTVVERLRLSDVSTGRRWSIRSRGPDRMTEEDFDFVTVANGHYSDGWVPDIPGLSSFPGEILHSRFYRRPEDYAGRTIMVVGSFASGSDLSRQLASLNLSNQGGRTKVYVSSSGTPNTHAAASDDSAPWKAHIIDVPLISLVERNSIHFQPASRLDGLTSPPVDDVDTMIFATGYNYAFPFCKVTDRPWCDTRLLDGCIAGLEREGGASWEVGGSKGLGMGGLDGTMVFLKGDGSVAFPALQYQIVPFPLAEVQTRLAALSWAGLLPSLPSNPMPPPNPTNPYSSADPTAKPTAHGHSPSVSDPPSNDILSNGHAKPGSSIQHTAQPNDPKHPAHDPTVRKVVAMRQAFVFGAPYEWTYEEWLMSLMTEAGPGEEGDPGCWEKIERWRRARRADTGLRKRLVGY